MGKLLGQFDGSLTVGFGHAGGLVKQPKNGFPCFIEF